MKPKDQTEKSLEQIVRERREAESLRDIPKVLIPVWQIKLRERFGINVDREIAAYVVMATHENGTWKRQRATRKIQKILIERGVPKEESLKRAKEIVDLSVGNSQ
jgi:hypothetical protein